MFRSMAMKGTFLAMFTVVYMMYRNVSLDRSAKV